MDGAQRDVVGEGRGLEVSSFAGRRSRWGIRIEGIHVSINLDWPQGIDETEFLLRMKSVPKGKTFKFLS